jgi:RES domain-containing protein
VSDIPLASIEGRFYRITRADRAHLVLEPPRPVDCGRYHAPGQTALYMSATAEWARVAVSGYMREDGLARMVFPLLVAKANVLDLRDEEACLRLGLDRELANVSWRKTLAASGRPPSWDVADAVRRTNADGLIDRSRLRPGAWHVTLFRWNALGGPRVQLDGDAELIR